MSVIISNMAMPKNCAECRLWGCCKCLKDFTDYESILCAVDSGDLVRASGCPLVDTQATQSNDFNVLNALDCVSRVQALTNIKSLYPEAPRINFMDNLAQWKKKYSQYMECERVIKNLPSAQPEIVRCKDCLYGLKGIPYRCRLAHDTDSENWYCADAKKREI